MAAKKKKKRSKKQVARLRRIPPREPERSLSEGVNERQVVYQTPESRERLGASGPPEPRQVLPPPER